MGTTEDVGKKDHKEKTLARFGGDGTAALMSVAHGVSGALTGLRRGRSGEPPSAPRPEGHTH